MSFLLIPHLKVQSANALACGFIVNNTPIMAITQFVHHLVVRHLECEVLGVAIQHHHAEHQALTELAYHAQPHQRRSALLINDQDYVGNGAKGPTLSAQPTASCNLELSLLIEFEGLYDQEALTRFLSRARLAGGQVIANHPPVTVDTEKDIQQYLGKGGYWLIERPELIEEHNPLESAFKAMEQPPISTQEAEALRLKHPETHTRPLHERTHAWVVPTVLGYAAITDFEEREGVRLSSAPNSNELQMTPHAYAEPLIGMVQYVPLRQWQEATPYWRQHWLDSDTFVVQCHYGAID